MKDNHVYEKPAVIYDGEISTRAGSPTADGDNQGVDPAELFDE